MYGMNVLERMVHCDNSTDNPDKDPDDDDPDDDTRDKQDVTKTTCRTCKGLPHILFLSQLLT